MFPNNIRRTTPFVPLLAALSFLAHIHYSRAIHSMKSEHHAFTGSSVSSMRVR